MLNTYEYEKGEAENELIVLNGTERESYNLLKIPDVTSLTVTRAVDDLCGKLNPGALCKNLATCGDLFEITYYAVDGIEGLQSSVWKLRENMNLAAIDSAEKYIRSFMNRINKIPTYYRAGVNALLVTPAHTDKAIRAFELISKEAAEISKGADELTSLFKGLIKDASAIVTQMIEAKALDDKKKEQLQDNIAQIEAAMEGLQIAQQSLDEEIEELTEEYQRLDKKIDKATDQQFWLSITSALANAVGNGLSAYASNNKVNINTPTTNTCSDVNKTSSTMESAQQRLTETTNNINTLQKEIENLQHSMDEIDKKLKDETDDSQKKQLKEEKSQLAATIESKKTNKLQLESQAREYESLILGISAGLQSLSSKMDKQGEQIADAVNSLTQMANDIFSKRSTLRKEKRNILQKMAEYSKKVENSVVTKNSLDLAISALSAGITGMNYIVCVLNDFVVFWQRLTTQCNNMASGDIENDIFLYDYNESYFHTADFYYTLLSNASEWVALKIVLEQYYNGFSDFQEKLQAQLKVAQDKDPEVMWKKAIDKSKGMSDLIMVQAEIL